jgi:hypothetical protein
MERYAAKDMAIIEPSVAPEMALAMAWRMKHVVNTLDGLPMHVAIVNGLKR